LEALATRRLFSPQAQGLQISWRLKVGVEFLFPAPSTTDIHAGFEITLKEIKPAVFVLLRPESSVFGPYPVELSGLKCCPKNCIVLLPT